MNSNTVPRSTSCRIDIQLRPRRPSPLHILRLPIHTKPACPLPKCLTLPPSRRTALALLNRKHDNPLIVLPEIPLPRSVLLRCAERQVPHHTNELQHRAAFQETFKRLQPHEFVVERHREMRQLGQRLGGNQRVRRDAHESVMR